MRAPISCQSKNCRQQNGGFIRAKLARPRTFCAKANGTEILKKIQNGGFVRAIVFVKLDRCHVTERAFYI